MKSRKQIDALFDAGKKINLFPFRLLYYVEHGKSEIKAGFTVSSRTFPRAVDRNRIKRLTREGYRLQKKELENMVLKNGFRLHLFFIYTGREIVSQKEISAPVKQLLDKLAKVIYGNPDANT